MRFSTAIEITVLALIHAAACEESWSGSHAARANIVVGGRKPLPRRQLSFGNGTLTIGGITLGGGSQNADDEAAAEAESDSALEVEDPEASEEAATEEDVSQDEVAEAEGEAEGEQAAAEDIAAVEESEQFSENIGIITDAKGNAVNLGGDLGITQGSDGSTSVGGEAGINIVA
ncbi:hypothetical protein F5X99DRAFT_219657 [Biscogniauxia marginata]|nr:hypothetical protein F5X99DRAFT_219657 [Biscogniauxia marginata]